MYAALFATVNELAHVLMHADRGGWRAGAGAGPRWNVAGWAESTQDAERTMLATAEAVVKVARGILEQLHTAANDADQQQTAASVDSLSLSGVRMTGSAASPSGSGGKEGS